MPDLSPMLPVISPYVSRRDEKEVRNASLSSPASSKSSSSDTESTQVSAMLYLAPSSYAFIHSSTLNGVISMEILLGVYSVFSASGVNIVRVFLQEEYILAPA